MKNKFLRGILWNNKKNYMAFFQNLEKKIVL